MKGNELSEKHCNKVKTYCYLMDNVSVCVNGWVWESVMFFIIQRQSKYHMSGEGVDGVF